MAQNNQNQNRGQQGQNRQGQGQGQGQGQNQNDSQTRQSRSSGDRGSDQSQGSTAEGPVSPTSKTTRWIKRTKILTINRPARIQARAAIVSTRLGRR